MERLKYILIAAVLFVLRFGASACDFNSTSSCDDERREVIEVCYAPVDTERQFSLAIWIDNNIENEVVRASFWKAMYVEDRRVGESIRRWASERGVEGCPLADVIQMHIEEDKERVQGSRTTHPGVRQAKPGGEEDE